MINTAFAFILLMVTCLFAREGSKYERRLLIGGQLTTNSFDKKTNTVPIKNINGEVIDSMQLEIDAMVFNVMPVEFGFIDKKGNYGGIYAEVMNIGSMGVYQREIQLNPKFRFSFGGHIGCIYQHSLKRGITGSYNEQKGESFTINNVDFDADGVADESIQYSGKQVAYTYTDGKTLHRFKYGGPEIRFLLGDNKLSFLFKGTLWLGHSYNFSESRLGMTIVSFGESYDVRVTPGTKVSFGATPAVSTMLQLQF